MQNIKDTICAVSTPVGEAGIAIVRVSGKKALKIADEIFMPKNGTKPSGMPGYTVHYGHIVNKSQVTSHKSQVRKPQTVNRKPKTEIIDEVLLTIMRAPKSYTKEDVVEINAHGGIACLKRILDLVTSKGARLAEPGEFTKRAFLNGRLDLSQAEAVLDMINARTDDSLRAARRQLDGELSKILKNIKDEILEIQANMEAFLDFPDEELNIMEKDKIKIRLNRAISKLKQFLKEGQMGRILREGITCVICGKPNAGKSTLMNKLLKQERVIVTAMPGTTRDAIEEIVNLNGIPLKIVDTAGIAKAHDAPSKEGILRSKKYIDSSDLILLVLDMSRVMSKEDLQIINNIKNKKVLVILNKTDLFAKLNLKDVKKYFPGEKIVKISAKRNTGIKKLEKAIHNLVWSGKISSCGGAIITNVRHTQAIAEAIPLLEDAQKNIDTAGTELITLNLKQANQKLGRITGETFTDDLLDRIFQRFCIGK